jgi:hypothetical protein
MEIDLPVRPVEVRGKERKGKEREAMHKKHKSIKFHVFMGQNPWRHLSEISITCSYG